MKNYTYSIEIEVNKFFVFEYNPEKKGVDPIQLPFMHDGEEQTVLLYRYFDKQEEAKTFFEMLSYFCTASEIEITLKKKVINEKDTIVGSKDIANFTLKDEDYPEEKIKNLYKNIDWDIEVELYNYTKEVENLGK